MRKLNARLGRGSVALSLAAMLGLGALMATLPAQPTNSVALMGIIDPGALRTASRIEPAARRKRRRLVRRPKPPSPQSDESRIEKKRAETEPAGRTDERTAALPPLPVRPRSEAELEAPHEPSTWSDAEVITALEDCVRLLAPIAAYVDVSQPLRHGQCGAPALVLVKRVGASVPVEINPPALVNCRMAAKLHEWVETVVQPAARETFGAPVKRLANASGYACRNRNGGNGNNDKISEHAFANALDISAFVVADGRSVDLLGHWGQTERDRRGIALARAEAEKQAKAVAAAAKRRSSTAPAPGERQGDTKAQDAERSTPAAPLPDRLELPEKKDLSLARERLASRERSNLGAPRGGLRDDVKSSATAREAEPAVSREGQFLRRLHSGACGVFSTVLGPEANEAHRNHFHLDLASRRRRAFCE